MPQCIEIIAYRIRPDARARFEALKHTLIEEAHTIDGLLSSTTSAHYDDPTQFVDTMVWRDRAAAVVGLETFATLPSSAEFLSLMTGPPIFSGQFHRVAGESLPSAEARAGAGTQPVGGTP